MDWNHVNNVHVYNALSKWQTLFNEACDKNVPFSWAYYKGHLSEWVDNNDFLSCIM